MKEKSRILITLLPVIAVMVVIFCFIYREKMENKVMTAVVIGCGDRGKTVYCSMQNKFPDKMKIVAAADILAIGAVKGLFEVGKRVPDDYSIIGFDDVEIAQYMTPGLTTIRQHISLKGQKAVELLLKHIEDPTLPKQEEILPLHLVTRGSVKKID